MARLSENPEYGFAVGRVRALETDLLERARYERLVWSPGVREFAAALAETAYSRFLEGGAADVPQALDKTTAENVAFLAQYALNRWLLDLRDAALSDMNKVYLHSRGSLRSST